MAETENEEMDKKREKPTLLDLGGGENPHPDATVVVDLNAREEVLSKKGIKFVRWDLNMVPLPFPDKSFDIVYCSHTLEHLHLPAIAVIREMERIAKEMVEIRVPRYLTELLWRLMGNRNPGPGHVKTFRRAYFGKLGYAVDIRLRKPLFDMEIVATKIMKTS